MNGANLHSGVAGVGKPTYNAPANLPNKTNPVKKFVTSIFNKLGSSSKSEGISKKINNETNSFLKTPMEAKEDKDFQNVNNIEGSLNLKTDKQIGQAITTMVADDVLSPPPAKSEPTPMKDKEPTVFKEKDGWFSIVKKLVPKKKSLPPSVAKPSTSYFYEAKSPILTKATILRKDFDHPKLLLAKLNHDARMNNDDFASAKRLVGGFLPLAKDNPELATTLHLVADKTADQLAEAGKMEEAFAMRALAATIPLSSTHPLAGKMSEKVAKTPIGTHFSHLDTGVVKGGNVHGLTRKINGKVTQAFDFKISHPSRSKLNRTLGEIWRNQDSFQASLPEGFGKVTIESKNYIFKGKSKTGNFSDKDGLTLKDAKADVVTFEGKGKVIIGSSEQFACLHNSISIEMDPRVPEEERLATMQGMLSVLGLGPVFGEQRAVDNERIKMAQLFRAYYPAEAFRLERSSWFYEIPLPDLKNDMNMMAPGMKHRWGELDKMVEEEIFPGKKVWCVPNISESMRKSGAIGLMAGVGGSYSGSPNESISRSADTVCLILKNGALSSQDRFQAGLFKKGASSTTDLATGGGDTVFTRCITPELEKNRKNNYAFQGNIQILYDLDIVNRGAYGYSRDNFGTRQQMSSYATRSNLPALAGEINRSVYASLDNEIMIKNRIDPSNIRGLVVKNEGYKKVMIKKLRAAGVVEKRNDGEYVNGKPIDEFVHVATHFSATMWDKPKSG